MKAVVTVGVSASGKSTYAQELVKQGYTEINRDWIRFNVVQPGSTWANYKWKNEKEVTRIHGQMIMEAWERSENIVVSDTNLATGRRNQLVQHLTDLGYDVEIKVLECSLETAWKRDNLRPNGVGENVIYGQNLRFLDFLGRKTYTPNPDLPSTIIVDVDGTIAQMNGRGAFDWKRVGEDLPRQLIIDMVKNYYDQGYEIVIVSGRSDECRQETIDWLDKHCVPCSELHMRKAGDYRKDNAVKEEILWTNIADRYNVVACIDDRPQMIRLWHELRVPNVICVGNPYVEF